MRKRAWSVWYVTVRYVECPATTNEIGCGTIKRIQSLLVLVCIIFTGCGRQNANIDAALSFRQRLVNSSQCNFKIEVTADYGTAVYQFLIGCSVDSDRNIKFEVIAPDSISGISGMISPTGGKITFDDEVLSFPLMTEGELSPISAPWILYNGLCSGYLNSCGSTKEGTQLIIDDVLADTPVQIIVWADRDFIPQHCEILWDGRCIMSIMIENFELQ